MPHKRVVMELGMGTDIRGSDYTKAAIRAVENALRQNTLTVANAFDIPHGEMRVDIVLGAAKPEEVDVAKVAAVLPYGSGEVRVKRGGMDTPREDGSPGTIMVNAALIVYLDLPDGRKWVAA